MRVRLVQNTFSHHYYIELNYYDDDKSRLPGSSLGLWKDFDPEVLGRNRFDVQRYYVDKANADIVFRKIKEILGSRDVVVDQFVSTRAPIDPRTVELSVRERIDLRK